MVSFSKNKILSAAVFASVLLLDNNNSEFNNNLFSKNAKGLNSNKRLLHESQAHAALFYNKIYFLTTYKNNKYKF
ncbi:small histidine-alanine-rich protein [Plasmodium falciparum NF135/5.C10]|uniref:Small histidine-alanine-rich protein n=2 Tax=Plasmodium falciparum TaxID=5833 RepID=A0A024V1Q1_PLAFA|nr:small histidine-alanine-rich protein [Plasmodium falciparum Vietnam Oak-Knoll (FVO)]ETW40485.1 small histidine-alanine-rich protein [Plasmodium falciparum NF135/5.C10]